MVSACWESGPAARCDRDRDELRLRGQSGLRNAIAFDMGAPPPKAGVILDGVELTANQVMVGGYAEGLPIQIPMIDIEEVGTGGGSHRPSRPGQVTARRPGEPRAPCPGRCATRQRAAPSRTVTDANLLLGPARPDLFLGGEMKLDVDGRDPRAVSPLRSATARIGRLRRRRTAIIRIAVTPNGQCGEACDHGARLDARDFAMVAYGGRGPLHAVLVARELQISARYCSQRARHFSAYGMLVSDLRRDYVRTLFARSGRCPLRQLQCRVPPRWRSVAAATSKALRPERLDIIVKHAVDMRYNRQEHAVTVEV